VLNCSVKSSHPGAVVVVVALCVRRPRQRDDVDQSGRRSMFDRGVESRVNARIESCRCRVSLCDNFAFLWATVGTNEPTIGVTEVLSSLRRRNVGRCVATQVLPSHDAAYFIICGLLLQLTGAIARSRRIAMKKVNYASNRASS